MHFVDDVSHKGRLLDHLLRDVGIDQALVFTATKRDADTIADRLTVAGFSAAALHGDMHQAARNRTLNAMRRGQLRVLVATDVAARGIDVPTITHVFNFDLPKSPEDYVHRIGRTGRAGRNGLAISLAHHAEVWSVRNIERFTRQQIPWTSLRGMSPADPRPRLRANRPAVRSPGTAGRAPPSATSSAGPMRRARAATRARDPGMRTAIADSSAIVDRPKRGSQDRHAKAPRRREDAAPAGCAGTI